MPNVIMLNLLLTKYDIFGKAWSLPNIRVESPAVPENIRPG